MSGHTPGPWRLCYDGQIDGPDGKRICAFDWDSYKEFNASNNAANARLIAAAPELLELLKGVAAIAHSGGLAGMSESEALAAIRKATLVHWDKTASDTQTRAAIAKAEGWS